MTNVHSGNAEAAARPQGPSALGGGGGNNLNARPPPPKTPGNRASQPRDEAGGREAGAHGLGRVKNPLDSLGLWGQRGGWGGAA